MDNRARLLLEVENIRGSEGGDRSTRADNARSERGHGLVASTVSRRRSRLAEPSTDSQYHPFDQQYRRHQPTLPPGSEDSKIGRSQPGRSVRLRDLWMM